MWSFEYTYSAFQESVMVYNNNAIVIDRWTYLASVYQLYDFVSSFWFPEFTNQKISFLKFTSTERIQIWSVKLWLASYSLKNFKDRYSGAKENISEYHSHNSY